jgi:hypothetical protein
MLRPAHRYGYPDSITHRSSKDSHIWFTKHLFSHRPPFTLPRSNLQRPPSTCSPIHSTPLDISKASLLHLPHLTSNLFDPRRLSY